MSLRKVMLDWADEIEAWKAPDGQSVGNPLLAAMIRDKVNSVRPLGWMVIEDGMQEVYATRDDAEDYIASGAALYNPVVVAIYREGQ